MHAFWPEFVIQSAKSNYKTGEKAKRALFYKRVNSLIFNLSLLLPTKLVSAIFWPLFKKKLWGGVLKMHEELQ